MPEAAGRPYDEPGSQLGNDAGSIARSSGQGHDQNSRKEFGAADSGPPRLPVPSGRVGGCKRPTQADPGLLAALDVLLKLLSADDLNAPLRWTAKNLRFFVAELVRWNHPVNCTKLGRLFRETRYRLQANHKSSERANHPGRNSQLAHSTRRPTVSRGRASS